jgi:hypothetical protein
MARALCRAAITPAIPVGHKVTIGGIAVFDGDVKFVSVTPADPASL